MALERKQSMGIPKQVEEAGRRANELLELAPVEDVKDVKAPEDDPKPSDASELEKLKQKFVVLQGKYDKEIKGNLPETINRLRAEINVLKQQNKLLLEEKEAKPAEKLTPEDVAYLESEDLGGKTLEILKKLAGSESLANEFNSLKSEVNETKKVAKKTAYDTFLATVRSRIDGFDAINNDQAFIDWLQQPITPYATINRQSMLDDAGAALDVERVISIFSEFKPQKPKKKESNGSADRTVFRKTDRSVDDIPWSDIYFGRGKEVLQRCFEGCLPWARTGNEGY
jgi:hypothetical protein